MVGIYVIVIAWSLGVFQLAWLRAWRGAAVCAWFGLGMLDVGTLVGLTLEWNHEGVAGEGFLAVREPNRLPQALAAGVCIYILGLVLLVTSGRRGLRCVEAGAALLGLAWLALEVHEPDRLGISWLAIVAIAGAHFAIAVFAEFARPAPPAPPGPAYSDTFD